jgi:hypothetical protein
MTSTPLTAPPSAAPAEYGLGTAEWQAYHNGLAYGTWERGRGVLEPALERLKTGSWMHGCTLEFITLHAWRQTGLSFTEAMEHQEASLAEGAHDLASAWLKGYHGAFAPEELLPLTAEQEERLTPAQRGSLSGV